MRKSSGGFLPIRSTVDLLSQPPLVQDDSISDWRAATSGRCLAPYIFARMARSKMPYEATRDQRRILNGNIGALWIGLAAVTNCLHDPIAPSARSLQFAATRDGAQGVCGPASRGLAWR